MDWNELVTARYGTDAPPLSESADGTIQTILAHKSIRDFRPEPLADGTLELLVAAAQSAATSSNLQTWSVVALENAEHKAKAAALSGDQEFIRQAPLFLVFCADLSRLAFVSGQAGTPGEGLDYLEMFLMASVDASLAAQNAAIAAEALGLGICYVGGARNHPRELAELLRLPPRVIGLFGMAVGVPAATNSSAEMKPRLPLTEALHREVYREDERGAQIERYNATMREFYDAQAMRAQADWSQVAANRVATAKSLNGRDVLRQILQERGFELK